MIRLQRSGYRSDSLGSDIFLGVTDGLDSALWCYVCASIIFIGPLATFLPVGILSALVGWILLSVVVSLTSREPLHIATLDDQAIVIFGAISALMIVEMGDQAATARGLTTLLFIISATSLAFAAACYLVGRYRLARVLELMPFPVVCGFMASIGWLVIGAALEVAAEVSVSSSIMSELAEGNRLLRLSLAAGLGGLMLWATSRYETSWTLPAVSLAIVIGYFAVMSATGQTHADQLAAGWLFDIRESEGGVLGMLAILSFSAIDWPFVIKVIPQCLTILLLALMSTSLSLSALKAESRGKLAVGDEFTGTSAGNLCCAAVACPPGFTDVIPTIMFRQFGASSRWMPLTAISVVIAVALFGGWIIGGLPKLLMAATIFLFAYETLYEWLFRSVRGFSRQDQAIVWIILGTTVFLGFMQGIGLGILLALLLFVFRYSRVPAIHSRTTLNEHPSSVERSSAARQALQREGASVGIYCLRGFLFFGTANSIQEQIAEQEPLDSGERQAILIDMQRVTGIDISALNAFAQLCRRCEAEKVQLCYSGVPPDIREPLLAVGAVSRSMEGGPLIFDSLDLALEHIEDRVLAQVPGTPGNGSIRDDLLALVGDDNKADLLLQVMERMHCAAGETLFRQGDLDTAMFIVEQGSLSAHIPGAGGQPIRVRKFMPGALVGELSAYLAQQHRTATVVADEDSVVYRLDLDRLEELDRDNHEVRACIHELVARTLAERVSAMNERFALELR